MLTKKDKDLIKKVSKICSEKSLVIIFESDGNFMIYDKRVYLS